MSTKRVSSKKPKADKAAKVTDDPIKKGGATAVAERPAKPAEMEEGFVGEQTPEEEAADAAKMQAPPAREPKGDGLAQRLGDGGVKSLKEKPFNPADYRESDKQMTHAERIAESREALKHPLAPGMKFFEAPDGYIIVGEANRDHVPYRYGNNGKGMSINPRRA